MLSRNRVAAIAALALVGLVGSLVYSDFVGQGMASFMALLGMVLLASSHDGGEAYLAAGLAVFLLAGIL